MAAHVLGALDVSTVGVLHDVQMDYYGKRAAVAADNHNVYICDVAEGVQRPVAELKSHESPVWKVAWAHPKFGSILASCGYDMKVIVWKEVAPTQWQVAHVDLSHAASVNHVEFCPWQHGLRLACASSDGTISILTHCPQDQQWQRTMVQAHAAGARTLSWCPVDDSVSSNQSPTMRFVSGGCDHDVKVWMFENDAWTQEMPPVPAVHSDWVQSVAWKPSDPQVMASGSWDKTVVVWKKESAGQCWQQVAKLPMLGKVEGLSWSVTGGNLAVACGGECGTVLYREAQDGSYVEVGKVEEPGFVDVPNSLTSALAVPVTMPEPPQQQKGVRIETLRPGDGKNFPKKGDTVTMHYTGTIASTGKKFDSSYDRGTPFKTRIGLGEVIDGWDVGVIQMCLGQKAVLRISPELGYGEEGAGNGVIPPNAELIFEVELLTIN